MMAVNMKVRNGEVENVTLRSIELVSGIVLRSDIIERLVVPRGAMY